jgi:uncharacterized protein (TIGR00369 family)
MVSSEGRSEATPPVPFFLLNGLEIHEVGEGGAVCSSEVRPWLAGAGELGIQAATIALADCVLNYSATHLLSGGSFPVSLGLRLDYWRHPPALGSGLTGHASLEAAVGDALLVRGRIEGPAGVLATATLRSMLVSRSGPTGGASRSMVAKRELVPIPPEPGPPPPPAGAGEALEAVLSLPAARLAGMRALRVGEGIVEVAGRAGAELERTEGVVHGGAVPVIGQLGCAAALASAFPDAPAPRRLDTNTEFLRPTLVDAPITIRARVVHQSRRVVVAHAEILNEEGKPTARIYETAMTTQG